MQLQKRTLLGVDITISPKEAILAYIQSFLSTKTQEQPARIATQSVAGGRTKNQLTIVTPNPEQIMLARKDPSFQAILNTADIALPDGVGVVWALKKVTSDGLRVTGLERISGVDFMEELCAMASEYGWSVAFIGGRNGVAGEAFTALQKKYPGLKGFADESIQFSLPAGRQEFTKKSPFDFAQGRQTKNYFEALARRIEEENIRFVFVGLGAPKQEYFIEVLSSPACNALRSNAGRLFLVPSESKHINNISKNQELRTRNSLVLMSVGGSFDIFAGKIMRAPKSVQKLGFEWLWRLFQEPWRITRQRVLVPFLFRSLFSK